MSTNSLPSAEVAADFRDALQDLKINSRPEISNLTVIAKENTEYAHAISRELEDHIRKTRPEWKLPALYVLDSIVKNVGTPYTVYLGRNLYSTFMGAYSLVDSNTRKAMEALLKTWKQPVPESLDPRPVFPADVTRDIENALIKFRTVTLQHQQQSRPSSQALPPRPAQGQPQQWRNTPTPPQAGYQLPPNGQPHFNSSITQPPAIPSPLRQYASPASTTNPALFARPSSQVPPQGTHSSPDLAKVKRDVDQLIVSVTLELTNNASESNKSLLETLLNLQKILQNKDGVPPQALQVIDTQVARIRNDAFKASIPIPPQPVAPPVQLPQHPPHVPQPAQLAAFLQSLTPQNGTPVPPPPIIPPPGANPIPQQGPSVDVAALLQALAPKPTPPPQAYQPPPSAPPVAPQPPPTTDLFESLRRAGLLGSMPPVPTPDSRVRSPQPAPIASSLAALTAPRLRMETATLKIPRPHLESMLYDDKPDICRQCGRRFPATEEGKQRKAKHMDWHFNINTRLAESSKGVVNRSGYIGELEWIKYREVDPLRPASEDSGVGIDGSSANNSPQKKKEDFFVDIPTDILQAHSICPVCREPFDSVWHDKEQKPVWTNAIKVGGKVYHKDCYDEISRTSGGGGLGGGLGGGSSLANALAAMAKGPGSARNTPTPESVLGKRKFVGEA